MTSSDLLKFSLLGVLASVMIFLVVTVPVLAQSQPLTLSEMGAPPRPPMPLMERGKVEMSHRDFDGAIATFTEVLGLNMNNTDALFERGQCYYYRNKFAEALSDFEYLMKAEPYNCQAFLWTGTTEAKMGHEARAVDFYLQSLRLNPTLVTQYLKDQDKAKSQTVNPKNQGAVGAYEKAIAQYVAEHPELNAAKPADSAVSAASAAQTQPTTVSSKEDLQLLVERLNEIIKDNPSDATLYFRRARTQKRLGNLDKALADLNEAIKLDPMKSRFYLARARLYHGQNQLELSQADVEKARSLDPTTPEHINFERDD